MMGEIDNPKIGNAKNWKFILKIDNPKIGKKLENWGEN